MLLYNIKVALSIWDKKSNHRGKRVPR